MGETADLIKCLRTLNERCEGDTCGDNQQISFTRLGCLRRGSEEKMLWMWMCSGNRKPSPDEALNSPTCLFMQRSGRTHIDLETGVVSRKRNSVTGRQEREKD